MRWLEADLHDRYACWEADEGSFDNNVHIDFTEARTLCEKWEFLWCLFHVLALLMVVRRLRREAQSRVTLHFASTSKIATYIQTPKCPPANRLWGSNHIGGIRGCKSQPPRQAFRISDTQPPLLLPCTVSFHAPTSVLGHFSSFKGRFSAWVIGLKALLLLLL